MQEPGGDKYAEYAERNRKIGRYRSLAKRKENREEENFGHKILPVNIDALPDIAATGGEEEPIMSAWQVEAKQMQHTCDQMKLARDLKIECIVRRHEKSHLLEIVQFIGPGDQM